MSFSYLGVFVAGLLTFLSPCVLPLAPILTASLVLSDRSRWARVRSTLWFSAGFIAVFVLMGLGFTLLGKSLGGARPWLIAAGGVLLALFGLRMTGVLRPSRHFAWMTRALHLPDISAKVPRSLHGLLFGALFGLSWTPCVGPILGGVLTYVASQDRAPAQGALLLLCFALGIALPLLGVAVASEYASPVLDRLKRQLPKLEHAAGLGLLLFGIYVFNQGRLQIPEPLAGARGDAPVRATLAGGATVDLRAETPGGSRMVFFYSENCPICRAMERFLPEFEKSCASDRFRFLRVNVDRPENGRASAYFNVRAVPTTSVLNEHGAEISHLVGYQTEASLREAARVLTNLACATDPGTPQPVPLPELENGKTCTVGASC